MSNYNLSQTGQQVQHILNTAYEEPTNGIPKTDLAADVQTSLNHAEAAYNQSAVNASDIEDLQELYESLQQSQPVPISPSDPWPVVNPSEGVIYRVVDRVNTPPQYYTDYMWSGTTMVEMAQYNNAIDEEPTEGSHNLVESGGVYGMVKPIEDAVNGNEEVTTDITPSFTWDDNYYINANSNHTNFGRPMQSSAGLKASKFLNISSHVGKVLRMTFASVNTAKNAGVAFYGSNDVTTVVAGVVFPVDAGQADTYAPYMLEVTIQAGWNYMRTTYLMASDFPTAPSFSAVVVDSTSRGTLQQQIDDLSDEIDQIWDRIVEQNVGKNIFTEKGSVVGGYLNSSGNITAHASWKVTDYLPVEPSMDYHISTDGDRSLNTSTNTNICFYDESKALISGEVYPSTLKNVTSPADAKFIRISYKPTQTAIQVERGTARTFYEEHSIIGGYLSDVQYFDDKELLLRSNPTEKMQPAVKTLGAVCFVWDDGTDEDEATAELFLRHGAKCGFALIGSNGFGNYTHNTMYKDLQHMGFTCLNHNRSSAALNSYATEAEARADVLAAREELEGYGLIVNGFVCPNNTYVVNYRTMLGAYHAYAFGDHGNGDGTNVYDVNTRTQDILRLHRWAIENDSKSLQNVKDIIDAACANGYFVCFYGHSARIGTSGYHDLSFYDDVLDYIHQKELSDLLFFGSPDECVRYYFEL